MKMTFVWTVELRHFRTMIPSVQFIDSLIFHANDSGLQSVYTARRKPRGNRVSTEEFQRFFRSGIEVLCKTNNPIIAVILSTMPLSQTLLLAIC